MAEELKLKNKTEIRNNDENLESADENFGRGNASLKKGEYREAIQYYNLVLKLDSSYQKAYNNRGVAYKNLKRYNEAILDYNKAIELDPNYTLAYNNRGKAYLFQKKWENAAQSFNAAQKDVLEVLSVFNKTAQIEKVVSFMLNLSERNFFNRTVNIDRIQTEKYEHYKTIYIFVLQIIHLLHVKEKKDENENSFAHYTKRSAAAQLLFKKSKFRLNSIITANDPQEGKTLLNFLNIECSNKDKSKHDYQAFIGCFTFNHESLNQFRLYGKEADKEATGVSLVLNNEFFNEKMDIGLLSKCLSKKENTKNSKSKSYALYRCIYLDPDTHKVVSLGHKEEYSFYREKKSTKKKVIDEYNEDINKIKNEVNKYLNKLNKSIKANDDLNNDIICELLLPLRYLVKHVAYKEEQECRIFDIKDLKEDKLKEKKKREVKFTDDFAQMYIEYQPITDYVEKIFFAPKTEGVEIFEKAIEQEGLKIECEVSSHPFS